MATLYDDEYHGARWLYGLQYRGITNYVGIRDTDDTVIPWIIFSGKPSEDPRFRNFGTYESAAPISDEMVRGLELVALGQTDDGSGDEYPNLTAQLLKAED